MQHPPAHGRDRLRPPRSRRRPSITAVLVCASLVLTACTLGPSQRPPVVTTGSVIGGAAATSTGTARSPSTAGSNPVGPGGPGRTAPPIQWRPCPTPAVPPPDAVTGMTVLCGRVTVPISYDAPARGSLRIAVAAAQTDATPNDAPPLVVMRGDPGRHSRTEVADVAASLPAEIREHYMIVMPDVRGTGDSSGVNCLQQSTATALLGLAPDPTTDAAADQLAATGQQLTFDCEDTVGDALTLLNSVSAADDLDTLRAALGVDRLSFLAGGGTATIAAIYAHRYPRRVDAMVLDSPRNPLADPADTAAASARAAHTLLGTFAAACPDFDGGCPLGADPVAAITRIVADHADDGVTSGPWTMTGGSVLWSLLLLLPHRGRWPELASAIAAFDAGRADPLARLLTDALGGDTLGRSLSGQLIFTCNDTTTRLTGQGVSDAAADARADAPLFGPFTVSLAALCGQWPAPDHPATGLAAPGAPPIVVIGSAANPRHPLPAAHGVATRLSSATLITWAGGTLGAYRASSCIGNVVDEYLQGGMTPPRGLLCPA